MHKLVLYIIKALTPKVSGVVLLGILVAGFWFGGAARLALAAEEIDYECVGPALSDYVSAVVESAGSLEHIKLLSPAFNFTNNIDAQIVQKMDLSVFNSLYAISGNSYSIGGLSMIDWIKNFVDVSGLGAFYSSGTSGSVPVPIMITEGGGDTANPTGDLAGLAANLNIVKTHQLPYKTRDGTDVNLLFYGALLFNPFDTASPEWHKFAMSDEQVDEACDNNCSNLGANSGVFYFPNPLQDAFFDRASRHGMTYVAAIADANDITSELDVADKNVTTGVVTALQKGLQPIIRVGTVEIAGPDPYSYGSYLAELDTYLEGKIADKQFVYAIAGPNEPQSECWATPHCGGCNVKRTFNVPVTIYGRVTSLSGNYVEAGSVVVASYAGLTHQPAIDKFIEKFGAPSGADLQTGQTGMLGGKITSSPDVPTRCAVAGAQVDGVLGSLKRTGSDLKCEGYAAKCDPAKDGDAGCRGYYQFTTEASDNNYAGWNYISYFCGRQIGRLVAVRVNELGKIPKVDLCKLPGVTRGCDKPTDVKKRYAVELSFAIDCNSTVETASPKEPPASFDFVDSNYLSCEYQDSQAAEVLYDTLPDKIGDKSDYNFFVPQVQTGVRKYIGLPWNRDPKKTAIPKNNLIDHCDKSLRGGKDDNGETCEVGTTRLNTSNITGSLSPIFFNSTFVGSYIKDYKPRTHKEDDPSYDLTLPNLPDCELIKLGNRPNMALVKQTQSKSLSGNSLFQAKYSIGIFPKLGAPGQNKKLVEQNINVFGLSLTKPVCKHGGETITLGEIQPPWESGELAGTPYKLPYRYYPTSDVVAPAYSKAGLVEFASTGTYNGNFINTNPEGGRKSAYVAGDFFGFAPYSDVVNMFYPSNTGDGTGKLSAIATERISGLLCRLNPGMCTQDLKLLNQINFLGRPAEYQGKPRKAKLAPDVRFIDKQYQLCTRTTLSDEYTPYNEFRPGATIYSQGANKVDPVSPNTVHTAKTASMVVDNNGAKPDLTQKAFHLGEQLKSLVMRILFQHVWTPNPKDTPCLAYERVDYCHPDDDQCKVECKYYDDAGREQPCSPANCIDQDNPGYSCDYRQLAGWGSEATAGRGDCEGTFGFTPGVNLALKNIPVDIDQRLSDPANALFRAFSSPNDQQLNAGCMNFVTTNTEKPFEEPDLQRNNPMHCREITDGSKVMLFYRATKAPARYARKSSPEFYRGVTDKDLGAGTGTYPGVPDLDDPSCGICGSSFNIKSPELSEMKRILEAAAEKSNVPGSLLLAVLYSEGGFDRGYDWSRAEEWSKEGAHEGEGNYCNSGNQSGAGAVGAFQILPTVFATHAGVVSDAFPGRVPNICNFLDQAYVAADLIKIGQYGNANYGAPERLCPSNPGLESCYNCIPLNTAQPGQAALTCSAWDESDASTAARQYFGACLADQQANIIGVFQNTQCP